MNGALLPLNLAYPNEVVIFYKLDNAPFVPDCIILNNPFVLESTDYNICLI